MRHHDAKRGEYTESLRVAERRGRADFRCGVPFENNPYVRPDHRRAWSDGWRKARTETEVEWQP
jgi:ribosome modulation factor